MSEYGGYEVRLMWNGVAVGQVRDVGGPATQQEAIDVTTRDDAGSDQYIGGLLAGGEVAFDLVYDPGLDTQTVLRTALDAGSVGMGELHTGNQATDTPDGQRYFALVAGFEPSAPMRNALAADVMLALTSTPAPIIYLVDHAGNYLVTAAGKYLIT